MSKKPLKPSDKRVFPESEGISWNKLMFIDCTLNRNFIVGGDSSINWIKTKLLVNLVGVAPLKFTASNYTKLGFCIML